MLFFKCWFYSTFPTCTITEQSYSSSDVISMTNWNLIAMGLITAEMQWHNKPVYPSICENTESYRDNKVHGANMGPIWGLSAPDGPHVGPMNLAIRVMMATQGALWCICNVFKAGYNDGDPLLLWCKIHWGVGHDQFVHLFIQSFNIQHIPQSHIEGKIMVTMASLIARFMGPTWDPSGADRTQVGPMLAPLTLLSGITSLWNVIDYKMINMYWYYLFIFVWIVSMAGTTNSGILCCDCKWFIILSESK